MQKKAWAQIQEKGLTLNIRVNDKKNCEQKVTQMWIMHLFAHHPGIFGCLIRPCMGHLNINLKQIEC